MKKYPDQSQQAEELKDSPGILEFPVAADFSLRPPTIELQTMLRRIEENMPWRNSRPGERERRLAEKIPVEFVL